MYLDSLFYAPLPIRPLPRFGGGDWIRTNNNVLRMEFINNCCICLKNCISAWDIQQSLFPCTAVSISLISRIFVYLDPFVSIRDLNPLSFIGSESVNHLQQSRLLYGSEVVTPSNMIISAYKKLCTQTHFLIFSGIKLVPEFGIEPNSFAYETKFLPKVDCCVSLN